MSTVVNNAMCRCCSAEGAFKNIQAKYNWMGQDEVYLDMIKDCFDIKLVLPEDFLFEIESGICEFCITQLRNALHFRKQVLATEDVFKKRLAEKTQISGGPSIKMETVQAINNDDVDALDFDMDENDDYGYEVPVKEEKCDPTLVRSKKTKRVTRSNTKNKKSKTDEAETSKSDSESDKKLHQKVKHLIKKKSVIKIEKDDDWSVSINKKADPDDSEPCSSIVGTVVKFLKPTVGDINDKNIKTIESSIVSKMWTNVPPEKRKKGDLKKDCEKMHANVNTILQYSNATPIGTFNDVGCSCVYCKQRLVTPAELRAHVLSTHKVRDIENFQGKVSLFCFLVKIDITELKCTLCDTPIATLEDLMDHLKVVHAKKLYLDVKNQILPFKFQDEHMRCCMCKQVFSTFKSLQEHMNIHYRNHVCKVCDAGFVTKQMLTTHAVQHLTGTFPCETCGKVFNCIARQKNHVRQVHIHGNMNFKCGYCEEKFRDRWKKSVHLTKVHGVVKPKLECLACDKSFKSRSALTIHTKRDHLLERKHECGLCDKKFFEPRLLKEHMIVHSGSKEFQCRVCLKSYARKKTLREHMRIHKDDRRFKCDDCNLGFVQKCSWKIHMKTKHGEIVK